MKRVVALFSIVEIVFKAEGDTTERQGLPRNVFLMEEFDFQTFFAG